MQLVINPDGHSTGDLEYVGYGVDVARRGWLEKKDVFNNKFNELDSPYIFDMDEDTDEIVIDLDEPPAKSS